MSRYASDLYTLLVDETYGQLTSRTFRALLAHGRSSIAALQYRTRLSPRQLKHGLSVLVQQHLVFWFTASDDDSTAYEANIATAYNLVRSGKYIKITEDRLDDFAGSVISHLLLLGHARVGDLVQAYGLGFTKDLKGRLAAAHGLPDKTLSQEPLENGVVIQGEKVSLEKINQTLCDLLQMGLVFKVHESHFRCDIDSRAEAEKAVPPVEEYKAKSKKERDAMWEHDVQCKIEEWKYGTKAEKAEIEGLKKGKKRLLEREESLQPEKRQRLYMSMSKKVVGTTVENAYEPKIAESGYLNSDIVLRVNQEKFAVTMRTNHLVEMVDHTIGTSTSEVYEKVLNAIEPKIRECQDFGDITYDEDEVDLSSLPQVSTEDIVAATFDTPELASALGQVDEARLDNGELEHPKKHRRKLENNEDKATVIGPASSNEEDEDEGTDGNISETSLDTDSIAGSADYDPHSHRLPVISPTPHHAIIRTHLLLLAQHPSNYLSHVPRTSTSPERWTIIFTPLFQTLITETIAQIISNRYGPLSGRLTRILSTRGKLDEKTLCSLSLIPQKELRIRLSALQKAGLLELQEVPRDNARVPTRTNFLYSFDEGRAKVKVLEECYKSMARCLQRLGVEKGKVEGLLEKAGRSDVQGREKDLLGEREREALGEWRKKEERVWGEIGRLDGEVGMLRDFGGC